jgi:hypothetical protein
MLGTPRPVTRWKRKPPSEIRRRKDLTIALGLLGEPGIVISADSQIGTGNAGDLKLDSSKINVYGLGMPDGRKQAIAVTGAGDVAYLSHLQQKIIDTFRSRTDFPVDEFQKALEDLVVKFYEVHVFPFDRERQAGDLDVDLVIGVHTQGVQRLLVVRRTTVTRSDGFTSVGAGEDWAAQAARHFWVRIADERALSIASVYSVYAAKNHAEGCGMETDVVFLPMATNTRPFKLSNPNKVHELEEMFRQYEITETMNRWKAILGRGIDAPSMDGFLDDLKSRLSNFDLYS